MAAIVVVEVMMDVLADVVEDAVAEEIITAETAEQITAAESTIESEATQAYNAALDKGEDVASEEAIESGYNNIKEYDTEIAEQWRTKVEANEKVDLPNKNPGTNQAYDDYSAEANPNQAAIDEDSALGEKYGCPGDPRCEVQKETLVQRYLRYAKYTVGLGAFGFAVYVVATQLIGGIAMAWCRLTSCSSCKGSDDKDCCNKKCEPQTCQSFTNFIQGYRKYFVLIMVITFLLSGLALYYFRSFALLAILLIVNGLLYLLSGQLGNIIATWICNQEAANCVFKTGKTNC